MSDETKQATPPVHTSERLIAFLDAAIAIALTLLILPLMEGVSEASADGQSLAEYVEAHASQLLAFALSFVMIALFWRLHHTMLLPDTPASRSRTTLQFAWLFTITIMPVVTALTGGLETDRPLVASYVGTLAASAWLLFAIAVVERRERATVGLPFTATVAAAPLALALLFTLTLLLGLIVPSHFWLFVMSLTGLLRWVLIRLGVVGREAASATDGS
ncbi:TMEM175 family protein [Promicromonospora sp. CA-289599]|uniref:TMEM175 family protein n=1 Tax=Promicromonospora sp. CA-289599 TaxID=3240014 RepID=UPI003D8B497E